MNNKKLKSEIKVMLGKLNISKTYFKKTLPAMSGSGYEYKRVPRKHLPGLGRGPQGHKPSLKQQYSFLCDLVNAHEEFMAQMDEQKEHIKQDQSSKTPEHASTPVAKTVNATEDELLGNVQSLFSK